MTMQQYELIAGFLTEQRAAIIGLIEEAYRETGGHYNDLTAGERHDQAMQDGDEFIANLLQGAVDGERIRAQVQGASDPTLPFDLLQMTGALERLFHGFVQEQLGDQPALAERLSDRATSILTCFHINITAAQIDSILSQVQLPVDPPVYPIAA